MTIAKVQYNFTEEEKEAMQRVLEKYIGAPVHHEVHASLGIPGDLVLWPDEALYLAGVVQPYYSFLADRLRKHPYFKEKEKGEGKMTAEEAVRYLEETHVIEPTVADPGTEDALEAIKEALTLAYQALKGAEWDLWADGEEYCVFCGVGKHLGHSAMCPRQLALGAIREAG